MQITVVMDDFLDFLSRLSLFLVSEGLHYLFLLRYLFVRWRLNVANMYVILGESGDTDHEEMIAGAHNTVIMKGVVSRGSEELLRMTGSYLRDDIVPGESPLVTYLSEGATPDEIADALKLGSKSAPGM